MSQDEDSVRGPGRFPDRERETAAEQRWLQASAAGAESGAPIIRIDSSSPARPDVTPASQPDADPPGKRDADRAGRRGRRRGEVDAQSAVQLGWQRLASVFIAVVAVGIVASLLLATWIVSSMFKQLDSTETAISSLVTKVQASDQAFQAKSQDPYISSEIALNSSAAQQSQEQVHLDHSLAVLYQAEKATQQADAQLATAEAALAQAQAAELRARGAGDPAVPAGQGQSQALQHADAAMSAANAQVTDALAQLGAALSGLTPSPSPSP
jgi:hypothetical protein